MRTWLVLLGLLWAIPSVGWAQGGGGEREVTADPVFQHSGNTWRVAFTSATSAQPVLLSSAPENAVVHGTSNPANMAGMPNSATLSLGIAVWRERYITNTCTAAALALMPDGASFRVFPTSWTMVILSSAGASTTVLISSPTEAIPINRPLGINPQRFQITHQAEVWGIWDTGSTGTGAGDHPGCKGGAVVEETYYSDRRRR